MSFGDAPMAHSILVSHAKKTYQDIQYDEEWRNLPEIPTGVEIMPPRDENTGTVRTEDWNDYQKDPVYDPSLPHNIIDGPWPSKEEYIAAHYQISRKDAIADLQHSVACVKRRPDMMDDRDTCIYTHVTFKGILMARIGPAFRVEFSHERAAKQIRWEQSKRLVAGTLVAMTPQNDMFQRICKIAVVAARPIEGGLDQNPPQIDLFWGDTDEAVFDPVEKYVMVEARSGYFEASRHMLVAMQKLMTERFNLANHVVYLDSAIEAPNSIVQHPWMNLNSLVNSQVEAEEQKDGTRHGEEELDNVDVLQDWPDIPYTGMDHSQRQACQMMLTKQIAIIQGPPGTGKTFVSVSALRVMMDNWVAGDPPIIVAAQTNHALDQLLTHISNFEPNFVRLGGRCDPENKIIVARTLFMLRQTKSDNGAAPPPPDTSFRIARKEHLARVEQLRIALAPMFSEDVLDTDLLLKNGIISQTQVDSLSEEGWADDNEGEADLAGWLTDDQRIRIEGAPPINQGLPMEESDIEFEQLQDLERDIEGKPQESADMEGLNGEWLPFQRVWTGKHSISSNRLRIRKLAAKKDLFAIPKAERGEIYRYWERQLNEKMLRDLRAHLRKFNTTVENYQVVKWLSNIKLINRLGIKVIGCTTTGLSKYRGLLAALEPRTILIEEAAETLEATIIAGMLDSLEQLILVGDHQQLQAHCNVRSLEGPPYNLNVSMFERLVNNHIGYVMLNQQRRMISDVRQLLTIPPRPFYRDLYDHTSVSDRVVNRPPIPGMGGKDTYFFHHNWPEACNADSSRYNRDEAEMIAGFFGYLVLNGVDQKQITVLTFYNGQRKTILKELKNTPGLDPSSYFKVHTVDSYQGEENDVILLSLVRSNEMMGIGFLDNRNRLVVALSRARRGLYIFGNAVTLTTGEADDHMIGREPLWTPLLEYMKRQLRFKLEGGLPITCTKHNKLTVIREPGEWLRRAGGCDIKCHEKLPCGHYCPYYCHPFSHDQIYCQETCIKRLSLCGHGCSGVCGQTCFCDQCKIEPTQPAHLHFQQDSRLVDIDDPLCVTNDILYSPMKSADNKHSNDSPGVILARPDITGNQWRGWNASESDRIVAEQLAGVEATRPKVDISKLVYEETFRPITFTEDGNRINNPKETRVVPRFGQTGGFQANGPPDELTASLKGLNVSNTPNKSVLPFETETKRDLSQEGLLQAVSIAPLGQSLCSEVLVPSKTNESVKMSVVITKEIIAYSPLEKEGKNMDEDLMSFD